jgi:hypothetical protein
MMPLSLRKLLLRGNAVFLLAASAGGMINDLTGAFLLRGPVGLVLEKAPHAAIGFVRGAASRRMEWVATFAQTGLMAVWHAHRAGRIPAGRT